MHAHDERQMPGHTRAGPARTYAHDVHTGRARVVDVHAQMHIEGMPDGYKTGPHARAKDRLSKEWTCPKKINIVQCESRGT